MADTNAGKGSAVVPASPPSKPMDAKPAISSSQGAAEPKAGAEGVEDVTKLKKRVEDLQSQLSRTQSDRDRKEAELRELHKQTLAVLAEQGKPRKTMEDHEALQAKWRERIEKDGLEAVPEYVRQTIESTLGNQRETLVNLEKSLTAKIEAMETARMTQDPEYLQNKDVVDGLIADGLAKDVRAGLQIFKRFAGPTQPPAEPEPGAGSVGAPMPSGEETGSEEFNQRVATAAQLVGGKPLSDAERKELLRIDRARKGNRQ